MIKDLTNLELFIEDHDSNTSLKSVIMYGHDGVGTLRWWNIFDGTIEECTYFKDNFIKGMQFLTNKDN